MYNKKNVKCFVSTERAPRELTREIKMRNEGKATRENLLKTNTKFSKEPLQVQFLFGFFSDYKV